MQKLQPISGYEAACVVCKMEADKRGITAGDVVIERLRALPESTRERIVKSSGQYEQQIRQMLAPTPKVQVKEHRPAMTMR